jgi:hypothetical protein
MAAQDNLKCFAIAGRTASGAATAVDDVDQEELRLPLTALLTPGYTQNLQTGKRRTRTPSGCARTRART